MKANFNKKAQGLPLRTIIVALLLIIVFVIMVAFFRGSVEKIFPWFEESTSCPAQGGTCGTQESCLREGGSAIKAGCPEGTNAWCCIKGKG